VFRPPGLADLFPCVIRCSSVCLASVLAFFPRRFFGGSCFFKRGPISRPVNSGMARLSPLPLPADVEEVS